MAETVATITTLERAAIYPAKHFVTQRPTLERAVKLIREELTGRLTEMRANGRLLEAQRLESRTNFDIEMMLEIGTCAGIENYSRHLSGREAGERPACLFDYFPEDFLVVVDESHVTLPQIGGMFNGDRARKLTLVEYGFRLPSALDNRPLRYEEILQLAKRILFVSARNSSNMSGRLSSALGRRNPYSTSVNLRARSPLNMPPICGSVTCDSSTTTRKSSGK